MFLYREVEKTDGLFHKDYLTTHCTKTIRTSQKKKQEEPEIYCSKTMILIAWIEQRSLFLKSLMT